MSVGVEPPGFQRITCPACDVGLIGYQYKDKTVTGWCATCGHLKPQHRSARSTPAVAWNGGFDDIRRIPSAWFAPILTDEEVGRDNMIRCPFHDDNRPSLHLRAEDAGWFCHGCSACGGLPEFYCRLQGRIVPTDRREFAKLIYEIADTLRRSA